VVSEPYEALYGRPCRSPTCWDEIGERRLIGPELVQICSEKVDLIRQRLLTAQSRQKSYADRRRRPLEFEEGDYVFLKVSPSKGIMRFGKRGKLAPRYIGPFRISARVGEVAYRLQLPPEVAAVHNVFHVSMLRKCISDEAHVLPTDTLELQGDLTIHEEVVQILERKEQTLRN
jgi:hypothetical protein